MNLNKVNKSLRIKIRKAVATSIYLNPNPSIKDGFHGYDEATSKICKLIEEESGNYGPQGCQYCGGPSEKTPSGKEINCCSECIPKHYKSEPEPVLYAVDFLKSSNLLPVCTNEGEFYHKNVVIELLKGYAILRVQQALQNSPKS